MFKHVPFFFFFKRHVNSYFYKLLLWRPLLSVPWGERRGVGAGGDGGTHVEGRERVPPTSTAGPGWWQGQHAGVRHPEAGAVGTRLSSGAEGNLRESRAPQAAARPDASSEPYMRHRRRCSHQRRESSGAFLRWKAGPSAGDRVHGPPGQWGPPGRGHQAGVTPALRLQGPRPLLHECGCSRGAHSFRLSVELCVCLAQFLPTFGCAP